MALYTMSSQAMVACDRCGCVVDSSERGRTLHARWHELEQVVDLTELNTRSVSAGLP